MRYQVILNGDAAEYKFDNLEFAQEFLDCYGGILGGSIFDGDKFLETNEIPFTG